MNYFHVRLPEDARRSVVWRAVVAYLRPWLADRARVLEVGAGYCTFINAVQAPERMAVDIDPIVQTHAAPGVRAIVSDVGREGLAVDRPLDAVLASNVFEHFDDAQFSHAIGEIHRHLGPKGRLIVIQPNFRTAFRRYFDDYTHKKIFTDESLCDALRASGFVIRHREARFLPLSVKASPGWIPTALLPLIMSAYLHLPWRPMAGQMLVIAEKP